VKARYRLALPEHARIIQVAGSRVDATGVRGRMTIDCGAPQITAIFARLAAHDITESEIHALAIAVGGSPLDLTLGQGIACLKRIQALAYEIYCGQDLLLRVLPLTTRIYPDTEIEPHTEPLSLRSDAYFQLTPAGLRVLAPLAAAEVVVESKFAADLMAGLCRATVQEAAPNPAWSLLHHVLRRTEHLSRAGEFAAWPFPDLLFHAASRWGSSWGHFGKRLHPSTPREAPPLSHRGKPIDSLREVLQHRRSNRRPGLRALTLAQLAEFLSLSARPTRDTLTRTLRYPYPSGGGIYGYGIYAAIHRCDGLEPGLYRYAAVDHKLERCEAQAAQSASLVAHAAAALALGAEKPDALLIVTADIGTFITGYGGIAYRLVLLGAGCLIQNMYLAATSLGLAGCAVGGGNPALFAAASSADPATEPSITEFALSGSSI
jgi:SagB-type dehydrogenase family enzyme